MHVQARRPPVGGGRHDDDADEYPVAQTQQPSLIQREEQAQVQQGTEGSKVGNIFMSHNILMMCHFSALVYKKLIVT